MANETFSVSLFRAIDNVFGAVRTCFDHVLTKFSGFSWKPILFLKSACVNMVMQLQVQIGGISRDFFMNPPGSVEDLENYILLRVIPNRICENDRELPMVAHWFAEEMTRARISTVWDKWPQA